MLFARLAVVCAVLGLLAGCAAQSFYTSEKLARSGRQPRILVMPASVTLAEITAGGLAEINAQWTLQGRRNVNSALKERLRTLDAAVVDFAEPEEGSPEFDTMLELQQLHALVAVAVREHHLNPNFRLPGKYGKFDWSLGPAVSTLGRHANADYALFVTVTDSYASAGRVAVQVIGALMGVGIAGGRQDGVASLIDLRTGEVQWINFLSREGGDLRTPGPARESIAMLLDKMPK